MFKFQRVFAMSSRGRTLKSIGGIVLPIALIAMVLQVAFPHATVRAVAALATPMYGCTSPSDCVSKMTLPEKEGQMTQVENNAFSQREREREVTSTLARKISSEFVQSPPGSGAKE